MSVTGWPARSTTANALLRAAGLVISGVAVVAVVWLTPHLPFYTFDPMMFLLTVAYVVGVFALLRQPA